MRVCALLTAWLVIVTADEHNEQQTNRRNRLLESHPRSRRVTRALHDTIFGTAASFYGKGEFMRLIKTDGKENESADENDVSDVILPNKEFTVMLWVKPEGGQYRYTPIIDVFDECKKSSKNGWTIGIKLPNHRRENARFVFSLHPDGAAKSTHLLAHKPYDPDTWTHVAVSFDGVNMRLYVNGAEMAKKIEMDSVIFRNAFLKCVGLFIGGLPDENVYFRGKIDEIGIWNRVLKHTEIVDNLNTPSSMFKQESSLVFTESFENFDDWEMLTELPPRLTVADISLPYHTMRLEAPPCGRTVCDDPEVVFNYLNNTQLLGKKRVKYRIINIIGSTRKNALVKDKQIFEQHKALSKVFDVYNISLELEQVDIRNDTLLEKVIMFDCVSYKIGDGICNEECAHSTTGNDAGDCDRVTSECAGALLGNGQCNPECNKAYHNYDNGDCCLPGEKAYEYCIDPKHILRGYVHIEEVKMDLQLDGRSAINVFMITSSWNKALFRGLATYPWEKNVYTSMGGNIMHASVLGNPATHKALVHEFGHNFGLWHVHHGITEMSCDDPCMETHPSMVLGDLCSDTNPTPRNTRCSDPLPSNSDDTCGQYSFRETPYDNYMSYAEDTCTNRFTGQQVARMHCYLDLVYQPMRDMKQAPPVPVAPKVIQADTSSVHIVWLEPLGLHTGCGDDNTLRQYADTATSSHHGVRWAPHEATGFPDAEKCTSSPYSWKPYHSDTDPSCDLDSCWLELGFSQPVIPQRLSIWVSDLRHDMDLYVELVSPEGIVVMTTEVPAYCDMETTIVVDIDKYINKVKITTSDSYIAIDAVEIISTPDFATCINRKLPKYRLFRKPAFAEGDVVTSENYYIDSDVTEGVEYSYRIEVDIESRSSAMSPELLYTHGAAFCGDGYMDSGEECDDKNAIDGDGCTLECRLEDGFTCQGSPSLCSVISRDSEECDKSDGKGRCELSAPDGFIDQWAFEAIANPEYKSLDCPASLVTGKPDQLQVCTSRPEGHFWRPCGVLLDVSGLFWFQIRIYKPVVATAVLVHLASDGRTVYDQDAKQLYVELLTHTDSYIPVGTGVTASCENNPVHIPVIQDLSKPFFLTKGVRISFTSSSISIYAIRVRSSPHINPPELATCTKSQLYNTQVGYCVTNTCTKTTCGEFPVKHGEAVCSGTDDGDSCKIQCENGYHVHGHENKATCVDGSWITSSPLHCAPVDCGRPDVPLATAACPDGTTYSRECHFKCDKPAVISGDDTSITCQRTGQWSRPKATCEIQCEALTTREYKHGKLKTTSCTKGPQPVGQQCKIRCQEGYRAEGGRNKRRFLRVICHEDGLWFGPGCVPDTCSPLPTMFSGAYLCTRDFTTGSTCTMNCPGDTEVQSVSCTADGIWDGQFTICLGDKEKVCRVPESTRDVKYHCSGTKPGETCKVSCIRKNHLPVLKNTQTNLDSGVKMFKYISQADCTVLGVWEPELTAVECVQQCTEWSIGDGFCDVDNNRDVCDWDGGDCCSSTVAGGMVLPIPDDCSEECDCKDPLADENKGRKRRH